jgi:hypothetical protein
LKSGDAEMLATWLFVRWLLDNEQDARWVETTHLFPLRESTLDLLGGLRADSSPMAAGGGPDPLWRDATATGIVA